MRISALAAPLLAGLLVMTGPPAAAQENLLADLSAAASTATVTAGQPVQVFGQLTLAGVGIAARPVQLERRPVGAAAWSVVGTLTTDADGDVLGVVTPVESQDLRFVAAEATSLPVRVTVRWALTSRLSAASAKLGQTVALAGTVRPVVAGQRVHLERWSGGAWRAVTSAPATTAGSFSFPLRPTATGQVAHRVWVAPDARHLMAAGPAHWLDVYRYLHTYVVTTRGAVTVDMNAVRAAVAATYADSRGWARSGRRFQRVASGGSFTVVLSEARYLPSYSSVCSVQYSCRVGRYVILNQDRWRYGSRYYPGSLTSYRQMVTNHETGHWLGAGHAYCPASGGPAPVMQQQSKGMQGCAPNPWPLSREIAAVS